MNRVLVVHPDQAEILPVLAALGGPEAKVEWSPTVLDRVDQLREHKGMLLLLSTAVEDVDCLSFLKKNAALFNGNVMLINFGRGLEYLLECLASGAGHFFDIHYPAHDLRTVVNLFFKSRISKERHHVLRKNIVREIKELVLENKDIYESARINLVLGYVTDSIRPLFDSETFLGLSNAIYEIMVNAVEHGNLGIDGETKERLLSEGSYDEELMRLVKENDRKVHLVYSNDQKKVVIKVSDEGKGFDWKNLRSPRDKFALSGRGLSIARHFFDSVKYNLTGNTVTLTKHLEKTV